MIILHRRPKECRCASCMYHGKHFRDQVCARSARRAMAAEFADESRCRAAVLGGREACDVMKLYPLDWAAMYGSIKRMPDDLLPGGGGSQKRVMVTPDLPTFKLLFRCFCGAVADLQLPENCFFAGSAVLAGATIPQRLYDRRLQEAFDSLVDAEQRCRAIDDWMMGSLKRRQKLPLPALQNIKKCLPPRPTIGALRAEVFAAHAEQAEYTDSELDVLLRTNNGSGPCSFRHRHLCGGQQRCRGKCNRGQALQARWRGP